MSDRVEAEHTEQTGHSVKTVVTFGVMMLFAFMIAVATVVPTKIAGAQTAGVQVSSFWGSSVSLPATATAVTRELTTYCPPGGYAIAGGWDINGSGAADVRIVGSYVGQKPYDGSGGTWILQIIRPAGRPAAATVTPYVSCVLGVTEPYE